MISRNLLAFVAVAEELHFGRAAQRLHISQPPLSQQIRQFEEEIGASLFVRTTRSVQLTPAGRLLLDRAHKLMSESEAALHAVKRHAQGDAGVVKLGFTHSSVYRVLPAILRIFREKYPEVVLELRQTTSDLLLADVKSGELDVALLRFSPSMASDELATMVVQREPVVLVMPVGHEFSQLQAVPVSALHETPWIGYEPQGARYFHELESSILASVGARPAVQHLSLLPTLLALVEAGMGTAVVPHSAVQDGTGRYEWRRLKSLPGHKPFGAVLSCVWRQDVGNPAVQHFVDELASMPT